MEKRQPAWIMQFLILVYQIRVQQFQQKNG